MAFLTGDDTADTVDIGLNLPDDLHLLAAVIGQLTSLTYESAWEQDGTATPAERVEQIKDAIANLVYAPGGSMLLAPDRMPDYFISHKVAINIDAGDFTAGSFVDRPLNSINVNRDGEATLVSYAFGVPDGLYWLYAYGQAHNVSNHGLRLLRVSDSVVMGTVWEVAVHNHRHTTGDSQQAVIWGLVELEEAETYKLQHRCQTTQGGNGMGIKNRWGELHAAGVMLSRVD